MCAVGPQERVWSALPDLFDERVSLHHVARLMSEESRARRVAGILPAQNCMFPAKCSLRRGPRLNSNRAAVDREGWGRTMQGRVGESCVVGGLPRGGGRSTSSKDEWTRWKALGRSRRGLRPALVQVRGAGLGKAGTLVL